MQIKKIEIHPKKSYTNDRWLWVDNPNKEVPQVMTMWDIVKTPLSKGEPFVVAEPKIVGEKDGVV